MGKRRGIAAGKRRDFRSSSKVNPHSSVESKLDKETWSMGIGEKEIRVLARASLVCTSCLIEKEDLCRAIKGCARSLLVQISAPSLVPRFGGFRCSASPFQSLRLHPSAGDTPATCRLFCHAGPHPGDIFLRHLDGTTSQAVTSRRIAAGSYHICMLLTLDKRSLIEVKKGVK